MSYLTPVSAGTQISELTSVATMAPHSTIASPTTPSTTPKYTYWESDLKQDSSHGDDGEDSPFNFYFLFLAAIGVLMGLLVWWIHRRRLRRRAHLQTSGQHALAQDVENLASTRQPAQRGHRPYQAVRHGRQDGLNDEGEAPPPYQPKDDVGVSVAPAGGEYSQDNTPIIPLPTLARDQSERALPPGYSAAVNSPSNAITTTASSRP